MIRSFVTVSTGTLASRLFGFLRDLMIASLLGTGAVADAFLVAFQFVNVVRRLLTEGALNAALVPTWLRLRQTRGTIAAAAFAGRLLGTISIALVAATLLMGPLMPLIMTALAPGFAGHERLALAIIDARLMLPYLAFAGPSTVLLALSSAQGRFALAAFSPLLFNIALIAVMIVLLLTRADAGRVALALAATIAITGFLQLAILVLLRSGEATARPLRVSFGTEMRGFFGRAIPGMVASAAPQLLMLAGAIIASASPSAVSWLYFANRLIELPLGIVGVAMGTVLIPELTRAMHRGDSNAMQAVQSRALELAIGLALPAMFGLMGLSTPIVRMLFEHGAFTSVDTDATSHALIFLALGLPAQVLVKAVSPAFFAREDTLAPLLATLKAFVVASASAVLLGHFFGPSGIAAALALGGWSHALALVRRASTTFGLSLDVAARRRLPRIAAAALAMGGALWLAAHFVLPLADGPARAAALLTLIAGAIALYALLLAALGVTGWREAVAALKQSRN